MKEEIGNLIADLQTLQKDLEFNLIPMNPNLEFLPEFVNERVAGLSIVLDHMMEATDSLKEYLSTQWDLVSCAFTDEILAIRDTMDIHDATMRDTKFSSEFLNKFTKNFPNKPQ